MTEETPPPFSRPGGRRRRLAVGVLGLVIVLAAAAGVVIWKTHDNDDGPHYPEQWDARVTDLVTYVEKERRLEFEHPVYIDFLSDKEFDKEVTADDSELSQDDRDEIAHFSGTMRALGLLGKDEDLLEEMNNLESGSVVGLYDFHDKHIRVRGEKLTPYVKKTLVHELTHVLQDQHYDLLGKSRELDEGKDSSAQIAWTALIEGDATRIEDAYKESLDPAESRALTRETAEVNSGVDSDLSGVPPFLQAMQAMPYEFGDDMLSLALEVNGDDAVDDMFAEPPTTEEQLLDPWTLLVQHQDKVDVPKPDLPEGAEEFDANTFGAPSILAVLASRLPANRALLAADGWAGDAYVSFTYHDHSCMIIDTVGDTSADQRELRSAWHAWIQAGPEGTATLTDHRIGDHPGLRFTACDYAPAARSASGNIVSALGLASARTEIELMLLRAGGDRTVTRCYAVTAVRMLTPRQIASDELPPAVVSRLQQGTQRCAQNG